MVKNKDMKYKYEEMFQRNIGIFTQKEQERIKNLKVAIAGAGGLGGSMAHMLVRLGVENINICDPEVFEISNINRQFGCYIDTIGKNKALAVADELMRINPNIKLKVWDYGINKDNVDSFIEGCDVVIDAIEFFSIDRSIELQEAARKQKKWVMTAQISGSMLSSMNIDPDGPHYGDLFFEDGKFSMEKIIKIQFPILPVEANNKIVRDVIKGKIKVFPSWCHAIAIYLVLLEDLVSFYIKKDKKLLAAPAVTLMDFYNKKFVIYNK